MAKANTFASSSPAIATLLSRFHSQPWISLRTTLPSLPSTSLCLISSKKAFVFHAPLHVNPGTSHNRRRIHAAAKDVVASDSTPVETAQEIVSATTDDGVSVVITALLFVAFIGLTILTIGVIYLAVTDFLQKREKEKFEKEEAGKGGKKKKKKVRVRAGPKGFGQKIAEEEGDN